MRRGQDRRAKKAKKEPLFTMKEYFVGAILVSVYAALLFSLDPEWVGWAGPLAFGGALYAADPPPHTFVAPEAVFQMATVMGLAAFLILGLAKVVRCEPKLAWLTGLKAGFASLAKASSPLPPQGPMRPALLEPPHTASGISSEVWNT